MRLDEVPGQRATVRQRQVDARAGERRHQVRGVAEQRQARGVRPDVRHRQREQRVAREPAVALPEQRQQAFVPAREPGQQGGPDRLGVGGAHPGPARPVLGAPEGRVEPDPAAAVAAGEQAPAPGQRHHGAAADQPGRPRVPGVDVVEAGLDEGHAAVVRLGVGQQRADP
ncbi:hypothetical protein [Streptomyces noursei]|uniref:hypothetical protein n=1 Tax=Streptomyces noursei TaxID=1971 RepID=UPI001F28A9D1|nr:hypothetical protein [Streptomyces noursei]